MNVLGLIPARGGSKGVPRKNIRLLHNKPLLAYTAETALRATLLARVILSTDDEEIVEVGRLCGLEVPFLRPPELAQDATPTLPVVRHVLQFFESAGERFDAVCLLQPTNPLRRAEDIDQCVALLENSDADSVVSILPVPCEYNPLWVYRMNENGEINLSTGDAEPIARRQDLPAAFHRDGTIYVTRTSAIMCESGGSLYGLKTLGYRMDASRSVNIDTEADWRRAEAAISNLISE